MAVVFERTKGLRPVSTHYCPGCTHGIIHRLTAEALEELGVLDRAIGVAPVGCSVLAYNYFNCDMQEAAHGRAPAVATGIKRVLPDKFVFTYQGDGDLASIGTAEVVHAAHRGENISIVFVNNAIYGMTGGQMAPTTLSKMVTSTSPDGRDVQTMGGPLKILDMLALLDGVCLATRVSVHTAAAVKKTRRMVKLAFENAMAGKGTSIVEVVSTCNAGWKMTPAAANDWMVENMFPVYPIGDLKNI